MDLLNTGRNGSTAGSSSRDPTETNSGLEDDPNQQLIQEEEDSASFTVDLKPSTLILTGNDETASVRFFCIACSASYMDKRSLKRHVQRHHPDKAFLCDVVGCRGVMFGTQSELDEHFLQSHADREDKKKYKCPKCAYRHRQKHLIELHVARKHTPKTIPCPECGKMFASEALVKDHCKFQHAEKQICPHCNEEVQVMRMHFQRTACAFCSATFACYTLKQRHVEEMHKKTPVQPVPTNLKSFSKRLPSGSYKCKVCDHSSATLSALNVHITKEHLPNRVRCHFSRCFRLFPNQEELQAHFDQEHLQIVNSNEFRFNCEHCTFRNNTKTNFVVHLLNHHLPKVLRCPSCKSKFANDRMLQKHIKTVHSEKPKCKICGKKHPKESTCFRCYQVFPCHKLLKEHEKGCKKPYHCRQCNKDFKTVQLLGSHRRKMHKVITSDQWEGVEFRRKNIKCAPCKRFFNTDYQLEIHLKSSRHNPKVKCKRCDRLFENEEILNTHIDFAHNLKCDICGKDKITFKSTMNKHIGIVHGFFDVIPPPRIRKPAPKRKVERNTSNSDEVPKKRMVASMKRKPADAEKKVESNSSRKRNPSKKDTVNNSPKSKITHVEYELNKPEAIFIKDEPIDYDELYLSSPPPPLEENINFQTTANVKSEPFFNPIDIEHSTIMESFSLPEQINEPHTEILPPSQVFVCGFCCSSYRNKTRLKLHVKAVHPDQVFFCNALRCSSSMFLSQKEVDDHYQQTHVLKEILKKYKCPDCDYKSHKKPHIQAHVARVHMPQIIPCTFCHKMFGSDYLVKEHQRQYHSKKTCPHCNDEIHSGPCADSKIQETPPSVTQSIQAPSTSSALSSGLAETTNHKSQKTKTSNKCNYCGVLHPKKEYNCIRCYNVFSCFHMLRVHSGDCDVAYHCKLCDDLKFSSFDQLRAHRRKLHCNKVKEKQPPELPEKQEGVKQFGCESCPLSFDSKRDLFKHLATGHKLEDLIPTPVSTIAP